MHDSTHSKWAGDEVEENVGVMKRKAPTIISCSKMTSGENLLAAYAWTRKRLGVNAFVIIDITLCAIASGTSTVM